MLRKVSVACAGVAIAAISMSSAFATCLTPNEQRADQVRALQTELMVGALKCGTYNGVDMRASYNSFVTRFSPQLIAHSQVLKSYFQRAGGKRYARMMDNHITALANAASLQSNAPGFCSHVATLAQATVTETPDEIIDSGKVGPGLSVKLGKTCSKAESWADDVSRSADAQDKQVTKGVKEVSASE